MELNFACINWVSSSSARVHISPDVVGVTSVVHPQTNDPINGAHGCLSSSSMVLFTTSSFGVNYLFAVYV
jgi:hypothetical protein